jgi:hypothetical protein
MFNSISQLLALAAGEIQESSRTFRETLQRLALFLWFRGLSQLKKLRLVTIRSALIPIGAGQLTNGQAAVRELAHARILLKADHRSTSDAKIQYDNV